jgi:uncharacterized protein YyaL (SSP411 family)
MLTRGLLFRLVPLGFLGLAACGGIYGETTDEAAMSSDNSNRRAGGDGVLAPENGEDPNAAGVDWTLRANETHNFIVGQLLTPHGSYRVTPGEDRTDEWHIVSQIGADAEMVRLGDGRYASYRDASFGFIGKLWDTSSPNGGYFATAHADGSNVAATTKFVDDNSLAGVTWLDARETTSDPAQKEAYLAAAKAVANFLMQGGVWDATYGGGFWWSTDKPDKPTQSNGLAFELFVRLAQITGESFYGQWANSIKTWLDGTMFDAQTGLYSWKMEAAGRNNAKFGYDQAILIEAHLAQFKATNDSSCRTKAMAIAEAMHGVLWREPGGYVISTEDQRLSPVFSAWVSVALAKLYEVDPDPKWRARAQANMLALDAKLRDPNHHGYYSTSNPDGSDRSTALQHVDQAWMQRAQAYLARIR